MSIPSSMLQPSSRTGAPVMSQTLTTPAKMGFQTRVVVALIITAALPLLTAIALANTVIQRASNTAFQQEFGDHLDRSIGVYAELADSMKQSMEREGELIARTPGLDMTAFNASRHPKDVLELVRDLDAILLDHPTLTSIRATTQPGDKLLAERERRRPLDERIERPFMVKAEIGFQHDEVVLDMVFAADRRRLDEMKQATQFASAWREFADEYSGELTSRSYFATFAALFAITLLLAVIVGILVVRPVIQRIHHLAEATRPVAEGDLSIRVQDDGKDEIAYLGYAFNRMLEQLGRSRARIDFLKRMGQWQQMARRLAHEIKNPLTPIQLAVEECHRRYEGNDPKFQQMLDTTKDIVIEEVQSLRRLVSEFAAFARLPRAALGEGDLGAFLREQKPRLLREEIADDENVELTIEIEAGELPVAIDRTMLYRVLSNLVANAVQAAKADHDSARVRVRALHDQQEDAYVLSVEDDGPGIPPKLGASVFDPYVTTKQDGSGLGLSIVKKIVIDHGGLIEVDESQMGGARFSIWLPSLGSEASLAALARSEAPLRIASR